MADVQVGRKWISFASDKEGKDTFLSTYSAVGTSLTHDLWDSKNQPKSNALSSLFIQVATTLINHGRVHENARRHEHSKCSLHIIFSIQIIRYNRFNSIQS